MVINKIPLKTNFQFEKCSLAMAGHVWIKSSINNKYNQNKWDQNTAGICITTTFLTRSVVCDWPITMKTIIRTPQWMEYNSNCTISLLDSMLVFPIGCSFWGLISLADDSMQIISFLPTGLQIRGWEILRKMFNICWNFLNVGFYYETWNIENCNKCCLASIFQILWKLPLKINGKSREK